MALKVSEAARHYGTAPRRSDSSVARGIWLRLVLAKAAKFEPIAVQQKGAFAVQLLGLRPSLAPNLTSPDVSRTVKE